MRTRRRASAGRAGVRLVHGLPGRDPGNDSLKCRDDSLECGARCVRQGRTRRWLRPLDGTRMSAEVATATREMATRGETMRTAILALILAAFGGLAGADPALGERSEEHTSEIQSLMRN